MKSLFLLGIAMFCTSIATAQNGSYYTVTLGLNAVANSADKSTIPFLSQNIYTKPVFFSLERHYAFNPDFSSSISFSMNQFKINGLGAPYKAVDVSSQFYFDDYMFDSDNLETYVGLGGGIFMLEGLKYKTLNVLGGMRYWVSDHYGINSQLVIKRGIMQKLPEIPINFQFNIGIIWSN